MGLIITDMIVTTLPVVYEKPHNGYLYKTETKCRTMLLTSGSTLFVKVKTIIRPENTIFFLKIKPDTPWYVQGLFIAYWLIVLNPKEESIWIQRVKMEEWRQRIATTRLYEEILFPIVVMYIVRAWPAIKSQFANRNSNWPAYAIIYA